MSYQVFFSFCFPDIKACYLPCILLTFFSFSTKGNDTQEEEEKSDCDGFERNKVGLLTQENILTPRNSIGDLI